MRPIILFDGVCNFCESSIQFILKREKEPLLMFASLQGEIGKSLLKKHGIQTDSVVFIKDDIVYTKSDAALAISNYLKMPWSLARIFIIVPRPIRNKVYDLIAKNRYKWFGQKEACMIPSKEVRARFLD